MLKQPPELLDFKSKLSWDGETGGEARIKSFPPLRFDTSSEYGGRGGRYPCPDELFLTSVAACALTTFLYFKDRLKLELKGLEVEALSSVKLTEQGYRVDAVKLQLLVKVARGQVEKAKKCIDLVSKYCHLKRSIEQSVPVGMEARIEEA
ncbi:MAG: OsmC family protein [Candidatus Nezhaarchaeota archaeon]|nr:OsmC family protein [Candidatus Nezhaarchaeota archaeon]